MNEASEMVIWGFVGGILLSFGIILILAKVNDYRKCKLLSNSGMITFGFLTNLVHTIEQTDTGTNHYYSGDLVFLATDPENECEWVVVHKEKSISKDHAIQATARKKNHIFVIAYLPTDFKCYEFGKTVVETMANPASVFICIGCCAVFSVGFFGLTVILYLAVFDMYYEALISIALSPLIPLLWQWKGRIIWDSVTKKITTFKYIDSGYDWKAIIDEAKRELPTVPPQIESVCLSDNNVSEAVKAMNQAAIQDQKPTQPLLEITSTPL